MYRLIISRTLLLIFVAQILWSCTEGSTVYESSEALLVSLKNKLEEKDYVTIAEFGDTNPFEQLGKKNEKIYHDLFDQFKFKLSGDHGFQYGNTVVSDNVERHTNIKKMTKAALRHAGVEYSEQFIDKTTEKLKGYKLTSEDMQKFFVDAEKSNALSPLEHKILLMECKAVVAAKLNMTQQDILRTVEYEVAHSSIQQSSKNKILMINAIARNLANDTMLAPNGHAFALFSESPFQQTTPIAVAGFFVTWAVVSLVIMFTDPNCDSACQNQMSTNVLVYGALAMLVCSPLMGQACPPCNPPCYLDLDDNCVGWPCDPI
jgi:hypothetical protein